MGESRIARGKHAVDQLERAVLGDVVRLGRIVEHEFPSGFEQERAHEIMSLTAVGADMDPARLGGKDIDERRKNKPVQQRGIWRD